MMSPYGLIDCHAHLYPPVFAQQQLQAALLEAEAAGVVAIVTVPENLLECQAVSELAANRLVQPCAGLHPVQKNLCDVPPLQSIPGCRSVQLEEVGPVLQFIRSHAGELVAVGEIGLDFSPHVLQGDPSQKDVQAKVFAEQILLANELDLPVNVHSRNAGHYAITQLVENCARNVLLHAFDGRPVHALKGAAAGFYFSVPPSIVRSPQMQKLVAELDIARLVLETDSPALAPEKGVQNSPANVKVSCCEVARIKNLSELEVAQITTDNACRLFPKLRERLDATRAVV